MEIKYIYWHRTNGQDGTVIDSIENRSNINALADKGEIKYFFVFPVDYTEGDKCSSNFPLELGRCYLRTRAGKRNIVVPQSSTEIMPILENKSFTELKKEFVQRFERHYFAGMMQKHKGNISRIAIDAQLNRKSVYRIMRSIGVDL